MPDGPIYQHRGASVSVSALPAVPGVQVALQTTWIPAVSPRTVGLFQLVAQTVPAFSEVCPLKTVILQPRLTSVIVSHHQESTT